MPLGEVLGGSWGRHVLRRSWGVLGESWGGPGRYREGPGVTGKGQGGRPGAQKQGGRAPGAPGPPFSPCFGLLAFPPGPSLDLLAVHHIALMESVAEVKSVRFRMSGFLFGALCAPLLSLAIDLGAAIPKNPSAPDYL